MTISHVLTGKMAHVMGGKFIMGCSMSEANEEREMFAYAFDKFDGQAVDEWFEKQTPSHEVKVDDFRISINLVTNSQFQNFKAQSYTTNHCLTSELPDHPVVNVTIEDAEQYCSWLSRMLSPRKFRLPTEEEWEYVATARGTRRFPWGDRFEATLANTREGGRGTTSPVGAYPMGRSEAGILDLAGNAEEWTSSLYAPYPGGRFVEDDLYMINRGKYHVMRGGSWRLSGDLCSGRRRHGYHPDYTIAGFRVCESAKC
jgi:formylglycine-generating enzyme required for sulfatase activity